MHFVALNENIHMQEPITQASSEYIAEKILELNSGYNRALKQPYSFYDLKQIRQELKELFKQLKTIEGMSET